jgi:uncharacterized membrane protein
MQFKQRVFIDLPTEEIFAYLSDLDNLMDWSSVVITARKNSSRAACVGASAQSTIRFLGRWLNITFEIVECEPGRCLTIKSVSGGLPCLFCYQFEAVEGGGTATSQESSIHYIEGVIDMAEPVVRSAILRQLEYDLLTLKDILEARTSVSRL